MAACKQGAVASEDFRGKENFLKRVFLPPNPYSFKNFKEGSKRMFCFTKYLSQSPFFQKFLKSEGGAGGCCKYPSTNQAKQKSTQIQGWSKIHPFCVPTHIFSTNQATTTSNKATPKRPDSNLLQSLRILYAKARRKNCVSVFRFPRVRNRLKR